MRENCRSSGERLRNAKTLRCFCCWWFSLLRHVMEPVSCSPSTSDLYHLSFFCPPARGPFLLTVWRTETELWRQSFPNGKSKEYQPVGELSGERTGKKGENPSIRKGRISQELRFSRLSAQDWRRGLLRNGPFSQDDAIRAGGMASHYQNCCCVFSDG